ncbi:DUF6647 family protein [Leptothrix discophora]|uniref:DUF4157 domain-containing protein n=1 Tax=Leptothrix discophora TaxID=89 RepID=A0ABT9FYQ0_LEPDI|nr:DUF6647 family protein [Leptothrix discophora]MDP4299359.1 hypothetical protein [Leptothrix discophora]
MTRPHARHLLVETALVGFAACGPCAAAGRPAPNPGLDPELFDDLVGWAVRLSGRGAAPESIRPTVQRLDAAGIARRVCPETPRSCQGLVGVYGSHDRTILLRDDLDLRDPTDQSFLVHELVHWLQHLADGDAIDASCRRVMAHEAEAYRVQNLYLARFRQWRRVGEVMRYMHCPDDGAGNSAGNSAGEPALEFGGVRDPHPIGVPVGHPRALGEPAGIDR